MYGHSTIGTYTCTIMVLEYHGYGKITGKGMCTLKQATVGTRTMVAGANAQTHEPPTSRLLPSHHCHNGFHAYVLDDYVVREQHCGSPRAQTAYVEH